MTFKEWMEKRYYSNGIKNLLLEEWLNFNKMEEE